MPNGTGFLSPSNPLFWLLVAVGIFLILLATDHIATAVVFLFSCIALICLIANLSSDNPPAIVWWIFAFCLLAAIGIGTTLVPAEWSTPKTEASVLQTLIALFPAQ